MFENQNLLYFLVERRRLEIARTLATNPKYLLLDEPLTGIDPVSIEEIKTIEPKVKDDVIKVFNLKNAVNSKKSYGGTSFENIKKMIKKDKNA